MPNSAQIELLESFIGEDGIYFQTILESDACDFKTKYRALDKIMTIEGTTRLDSLSGPHKPNVEEFIRSLKIINNLFFNNNVIYGEYGSRPALIHYFGALGPIDVKDFKQVIWNMIYKRRAFIYSCSVLEGILSAEQINELPKNIRQIIVEHPDNFVKLVNEAHAPIVDLLALEPGLLDRLIRESLNVRNLIYHSPISFTDLIALKPALRIIFIVHPWTNTAPLIAKAHVSISDLNDLEESLSTLIAHNGYGVAKLIIDGGATFVELHTLEPELQTLVINKAALVVAIILKEHIPFEHLSTLTSLQLQAVLDDSNSEEAQALLHPAQRPAASP